MLYGSRHYSNTLRLHNKRESVRVCMRLIEKFSFALYFVLCGGSSQYHPKVNIQINPYHIQ